MGMETPRMPGVSSVESRIDSRAISMIDSARTCGVVAWLSLASQGNVDLLFAESGVAKLSDRLIGEMVIVEYADHGQCSPCGRANLSLSLHGYSQGTPHDTIIDLNTAASGRSRASDACKESAVIREKTVPAASIFFVHRDVLERCLGRAGENLAGRLES